MVTNGQEFEIKDTAGKELVASGNWIIVEGEIPEPETLAEETMVEERDKETKELKVKGHKKGKKTLEEHKELKIKEDDDGEL